MSDASLSESKVYIYRIRKGISRWCPKISAPLQNQRGSAAVDYAMILLFVVLVVIAVIVALQDHSDVIFKATATVIGDFGSIKAE